MIYMTKEGDVLDLIAFEQLGSESHLIALIEANPELDLTQYGGPLPGGLELQLPRASLAPVRPKTRLSLFD
jgi:phage tail protein X